jgi:hypothetical protein
MLTDHRIEQERWARQRRERQRLARAFGYFIATLAPWDWFLNPLTMRDGNPRENVSGRGDLRREGSFSVCKPDPRLARYEPSSRYSRAVGPPTPQVAIARIEKWLMEIERVAGKPVGCMIAEEFGRLGGRWHCHALVVGVSHLYRRKFWLEAYRRFGYTRIEPFDPARGAAFYAAKYAGRSLGEIHFGGTLAGIDLSKCEESSVGGGGQDVAVSVPLPKIHFHMCLPRRHR